MRDQFAPPSLPPPRTPQKLRDPDATAQLRLHRAIFGLAVIAGILVLAIFVVFAARQRQSGPREHVLSSAMRAVGYDSMSRTLDIEFPSGEVYRYHDVPPEMHSGLMAAQSQGRYFHDNIRSQGYRYERLGWPATPAPELPRDNPLQAAHIPTDQEVRKTEREKQLQGQVRLLEQRIQELEANRPVESAVLPEDTAAVEGAERRPLRMEDLLDKAVILSDRGEYLGLISSDSYNPKSIMNDFGQHGSEYQPKSIFNEIGTYGGSISPESPWNEIAVSPPRIFLGDQFVGYLTRNSLKSPRIDPNALVAYLKSRQ
jgi:hypothetical protein